MGPTKPVILLRGGLNRNKEKPCIVPVIERIRCVLHHSTIGVRGTLHCTLSRPAQANTIQTMCRGLFSDALYSSWIEDDCIEDCVGR